MLSRLCYKSPITPLVPWRIGTGWSRSFVLSAISRTRYGFRSSFSEQYAFRTREAAQKTLRERLLGPTTGRPFIYGTYAVAGASAFGIGMLCYYGLGMSKAYSAWDRSYMWPDYVRQRLRSTYAYLAGGLVTTAGAAVLASKSPFIMQLAGKGTLLTFAVSIGAMMATGAVAQMIDYSNTVSKHLAWLLHMGVVGAVLAPTCLVGGPVLMRAAWYTAGIVAGLSATAACAPSEKFLNMAGPLAMGFGVVFVSCLGSLFFPPNTALGAGLASIVVYGGLILFAAFLLHDTQRVVKMAEMTPTGYFGQRQVLYDRFGQEVGVHNMRGFDPINAQLAIYMDILNIFLRMVFILGGGQRRK